MIKFFKESPYYTVGKRKITFINNLRKTRLPAYPYYHYERKA